MSSRTALRHPLRLRCTAQAARALFTGAVSLSMLAAANADVLKIADEPVGVGVSATVVRPNIAMVIDDSGSMAFPNMPGNIDDGVKTKVTGQGKHQKVVVDYASDGVTMTGKLCYGFKGYNTVAYDPTTTYTPPYDPESSNSTKLKGNASFTNATYDGYRATHTTQNPVAAYDGEDNWAYNLSTLTTGTPTIKLGAWPGDAPRQNVVVNFYYTKWKKNTSPTKDCETDDYYTAITDPNEIEAPGVTKGSPEARTNYANWYSYYRTRGYTMKAATGHAFSSISDNFRVGLFFLNGNTDQAVNDFTDTKKVTWYSQLYSSSANGSTPLRTTLANIGKMYGGVGPLASMDPVQYSCQQNFTILSTDGAWNDTKNPTKLDDTQIGNQDGGDTEPNERKDVKSAKNTLADTAHYYYETDLRTSDCTKTVNGVSYDVCTNNVPKARKGKDDAPHQHMTTFAVGLGVNGTMTYEPNYEVAPDTNDKNQYFDIRAGTAQWPAPTTDATKIDDLWHAAVNGRGLYFSAKDPASLTIGLQKALADITATPGSGTAAATANLELVAGDNAVYLAQYRTVNWDGNLIAMGIDGASGTIDTTVDWSARSKLDKKVKDATSGDGRTILYFNKGSANNLADFTYDTLTTAYKAYFDGVACPTTGLAFSQCANLTPTQKTTSNNGINLVNYLRGQRTYEASETNVANPLYRGREHLLGDIVNAMPVFVQKPQFNYDKYDTTYAGFKTAQASRGGTVYAGANDGMLHAFDSASGDERWAFVPGDVMRNMRYLADTGYTHRYFVDGSPTVADVCSSPKSSDATVCNAATDWRTILVAGLGKGGCSYYALDVTNPSNPKGLWEFTHDKMGYSYAPPVITRNKAGKWVAIFTSGYNNVPGSDGACGKSTGDGGGYVFVVDAVTGTLLDTIATGEGDTTTPSNLGRLNAWVEVAELNTADSLYAGDMLGNVWRIDFDNNIAPNGKEAFKLATLRNAAGNAQPISVKPELAFSNNQRLVMVGTGRILSADDIKDTQRQSVYGLKDDLSTTGIGNPRANTAVKQRTLVEVTASSRKIGDDASDVNWTNDKGWYFDFPAAGTKQGAERVNVDMQLQYNILTVAANVPDANACTAGGYGWLYYVDFETGRQVPKSTDVTPPIGQRVSNAMISGIKTVKLTDGRTSTIVSDTRGEVQSAEAPSPTGAAAGAARRTMWREIQD